MASEKEGVANSGCGNVQKSNWKQLLQEWDLASFEEGFVKNGWTDCIDWPKMTEQDLSDIGLKRGHIVRFERKLNELNGNECKQDNDMNDVSTSKYVKPGMFYKIKNGNTFVDNWYVFVISDIQCICNEIVIIAMTKKQDKSNTWNYHQIGIEG